MTFTGDIDPALSLCFSAKENGPCSSCPSFHKGDPNADEVVGYDSGLQGPYWQADSWDIYGAANPQRAARVLPDHTQTH